MRQVYLESDVGGDHPTEQGGFIVRDPGSGALEVVRVPTGRQDSLSYPHCPDGRLGGREIVGTFHTHPNVGPEWEQGPSRQDVRLSVNYPETMGPHQFVVSRETIYHINNDGTVREMGPTDELLNICGAGGA